VCDYECVCISLWVHTLTHTHEHTHTHINTHTHTLSLNTHTRYVGEWYGLSWHYFSTQPNSKAVKREYFAHGVGMLCVCVCDVSCVCGGGHIVLYVVCVWGGMLYVCVGILSISTYAYVLFIYSPTQTQRLWDFPLFVSGHTPYGLHKYMNPPGV
jgi:hypothetical protein